MKETSVHLGLVKTGPAAQQSFGRGNAGPLHANRAQMDLQLPF